MREILLPYYNDRRGKSINTLVIHASAQHTSDALMAKLIERELSSHYLVDEKGDDHLRETIADVLTHRRDADVEQVAQLAPRHRTKIVKRKTRDVLPEVDDGQHHHGQSTAGRSGNGSPLDA